MGYALEFSDYSVKIEGGFVDGGKWMIHGIVAYRSAQAAKAQSDIEAEARTELMLAIARESRLARAQGARSVYVTIDGDEELAGFFRMCDAAVERGGHDLPGD